MVEIPVVITIGELLAVVVYVIFIIVVTATAVKVGKKGVFKALLFGVISGITVIPGIMLLWAAWSMAQDKKKT